MGGGVQDRVVMTHASSHPSQSRLNAGRLSRERLDYNLTSQTR
jgi:hypothetical protein